MGHIYFEVMSVLSCVNYETCLIHLVGDTVLDLATKHHLIAFHEIVHAVFQNWHMVFLPNLVEVYLLIRSDLDSHITSDIIDKTPDAYGMIEGPRQPVSYTILLNFEKENS